MTEANPRAVMGGNGPPDPIDAALAPYGDSITEAEEWLDGTPVETEGQMNAVDAILAEIKAAEKAVTQAKEAEAKPLHDAWKAALSRYKPTLDDLDRIKRGLVATVDAFKRKLAAEKAEKDRQAREAAEAAAEALRKARAEADASNIEAQRAIAAAEQEAEIARIKAAVAKKGATVKGMVTRTFYEVTDHRALLHWIAKHDREAITAFLDDYARRKHSHLIPMDGVRVWDEKVAK
jgi:multidrug efflux pump subunit AcrA (membrane-fusion protein)